MGGKSSSSSTQQQTTQTQNLSLQDLDGVTVAGSENVTLRLSDQGAIEAGKDIAMQALDGVQESARGLFDFLKEREAATVDTIATHSADSLAQVTDLSRQALAVTKQTDSQQALDTGVKLGMVAVVVIGAAWALKG